jgi:hypothetical protein
LWWSCSVRRLERVWRDGREGEAAERTTVAMVSA